jgi:hypothetical protein
MDPTKALVDHDCSPGCCSHEQFLAGLNAAPQDVSLPLLQGYVEQGYVDYVWNCSPSAVDAKCLSLDGERGAIADLLLVLMHDAPIFEHSHVGCHCSITISGPDLPDIVIGAFGVV